MEAYRQESYKKIMSDAKVRSSKMSENVNWV